MNKSDAQKLTELLGGCWHERDWSKEPTMWVGGKGTHCFTCVKCKQPIPMDYDSNRPTYTHADEVLLPLREKLGEEKFEKFLYGIDWFKTTKYLFDCPALVKKVIEYLEQMKGE